MIIIVLALVLLVVALLSVGLRVAMTREATPSYEARHRS